MGLSSKQAAGDGLDWSQALFKDGEVEIAEARRPPSPVQGRQQRLAIGTAAAAPLRCPRCDSYNTKFCYYNNYSRSQPRHFCKSCRRHWTNGGTLRNVPIGGGRKNKRPKTSHASSTSKTTADDGNRRQQEQPPQLPTPSFVPDHLQPRQTLLRPPASPSSSDYFAATTDLNGSNLLGSLPSLPPMPPPALADPFYPLSSYSFLPFVMHKPEDAAASEGHDPNNGLTTSSSMVDLGTGDAGSDGLFQRTTLLPTCGFAEPPSAGGYWGCWDELAELGKPPVPTASGLPDLGLI